jgi:hypothetical protein
MRFGSWLALAMLVSTSGYAQQRFGDKGSVTPFGSVDFSYSSVAPPTGSSSSTTLFDLSPGIGYFLADALVVGGQFSLSFGSTSTNGSSTSTSATRFGLAPFVGYNIWLSERVSLLPQFALVFTTGSADAGGAGGSISQTLLTARITGPVLFHLAPHFFLGFGPAISADVYSHASAGGFSGDASKTTSIGLTSSIGGWF